MPRDEKADRPSVLHDPCDNLLYVHTGDLASFCFREQQKSGAQNAPITEEQYAAMKTPFTYSQEKGCLMKRDGTALTKLNIDPYSIAQLYPEMHSRANVKLLSPLLTVMSASIDTTTSEKEIKETIDSVVERSVENTSRSLDGTYVDASVLTPERVSTIAYDKDKDNDYTVFEYCVPVRRRDPGNAENTDVKFVPLKHSQMVAVYKPFAAGLVAAGVEKAFQNFRVVDKKGNAYHVLRPTVYTHSFFAALYEKKPQVFRELVWTLCARSKSSSVTKHIVDTARIVLVINMAPPMNTLRKKIAARVPTDSGADGQQTAVGKGSGNKSSQKPAAPTSVFAYTADEDAGDSGEDVGDESASSRGDAEDDDDASIDLAPVPEARPPPPVPAKEGKPKEAARAEGGAEAGSAAPKEAKPKEAKPKATKAVKEAARDDGAPEGVANTVADEGEGGDVAASKPPPAKPAAKKAQKKPEVKPPDAEAGPRESAAAAPAAPKKRNRSKAPADSGANGSDHAPAPPAKQAKTEGTMGILSTLARAGYAEAHGRAGGALGKGQFFRLSAPMRELLESGKADPDHATSGVLVKCFAALWDNYADVMRTLYVPPALPPPSSPVDI